MASQMCVEKKNMSLFIISQTQSEKIVQWLQCVLFKDVYTACRHLHITFIQIWRGHAYLNNEISLFFLIYVASVWTNVSPFLNVSLNSQKCFDIKSAHYKSKSFHWLIFGSSNQEQEKMLLHLYLVESSCPRVSLQRNVKISTYLDQQRLK